MSVAPEVEVAEEDQCEQGHIHSNDHRRRRDEPDRYPNVDVWFQISRRLLTPRSTLQLFRRD